jgi:hypothetical protein
MRPPRVLNAFLLPCGAATPGTRNSIIIGSTRLVSVGYLASKFKPQVFDFFRRFKQQRIG